MKPFACLQCDKGFSRKDHLKRHMMKVHGVGEVFEVILEKENEENVDDPMELTEVPEKKNVVVTTVPVPTPALSELKDKRLPKMVLIISLKYFHPDIFKIFSRLAPSTSCPRTSTTMSGSPRCSRTSPSRDCWRL